MSAVNRRLEDLHPKLKCLAETFLARCKVLGIDVLIYETFREQKRQDRLFAQGRTTPGKIVTWTRKSKHSHKMPGFSPVDGNWHDDGIPASLAFDAVPKVNGKPDWGASRHYEKMDMVAAELGLEKVRGDSPHYQIDL